MNFSLKFPPLAAALLATLLAACASMPAPNIRREGNTPRLAQAARADATTADGVQAQPLAGEEDDGTPKAQIRRGTGQAINRSAASSPLPNLAGTTGEATFNFEGESLHAVVKAILGDMLGQNYVIAPGVQGTVTLATPKPVSPAAALSLLEMVLGWNNARMVYSDGRYNIVPADQAVADRCGRAAHRLAVDRARLRGARGAAALHLRHRDGKAAQALCAPERDRQRRQRRAT